VGWPCFLKGRASLIYTHSDFTKERNNVPVQKVYAGARVAAVTQTAAADVKMRKKTHRVERMWVGWGRWGGGGSSPTSGTFLLNSRLSSTRCLWECSLSSCRPASSDATELSSLYKNTQKREGRWEEASGERRHFREAANAHPGKLRVYINKNTLLNINNVILHDLTAVILTASPGP